MYIVDTYVRRIRFFSSSFTQVAVYTSHTHTHRVCRYYSVNYHIFTHTCTHISAVHRLIAHSHLHIDKVVQVHLRVYKGRR